MYNALQITRPFPHLTVYLGGRTNEAADTLISWLHGKQKKWFQAPQKKSFKALQEEVGKLPPQDPQKVASKLSLDALCRWEN